MDLVTKKEAKKYILFATIALILILAYKILAPYLLIIFSTFIISYMVRPLFKRLHKKINRHASALICILLVLLILIIPLAAIINGMVGEANTLANVENTFNGITNSTLFAKLHIDAGNLHNEITDFIMNIIKDLISSIPSIIISSLIILLGTYYILIDWELILRELKNLLPFKNKNKISKELDDATKGIIHGSLLIAILQFFIALGGFYFSGVEYYLIFSALMFLLAFVPALGPAIVWVPLAAYYAFTSNWITLVGVVITGLISSIYVDTIFRAKLLGKKSKINSFIMLIGIMGGIPVFGIFGFIVGPLILAYAFRITKEIID